MTDAVPPGDIEHEDSEHEDTDREAPGTPADDPGETVPPRPHVVVVTAEDDHAGAGDRRVRVRFLVVTPHR